MGISCRLDDPVFESQHGQETVLQNVETGCGAHQASYGGALSSGVKRPRLTSLMCLPGVELN